MPSNPKAKQDTVRVYNNILSPQINSPPSPMNYDERLGRDSTEDPNILPRLSSLEAQAALTSTEISLLKDSTTGLVTWRHHMDAASKETANMLQTLDEDIEELKVQLGPQGGKNVIEELSGQLESCMCELEEVKAKEDVRGQLGLFDERLREVERHLVDHETFESTVSLVQDVEVKADAALQHVEKVEHDMDRVVGTVDAVQENVEDLSSKIELINLALEVVEQSLEDFEECETVESLRLRMDDLDVGIERYTEDSRKKIEQISQRVEDLKESAKAASIVAEEKADDALKTAQIAREEVAELRKEMRYGTPYVSGSSSPATVAARSSDARVKAAVHTLSDGYRSLHKAMGLMYDEQAEMSDRITKAAKRAQQEPERMSIGDRIRQQRSTSCISSFPIDVDESDGKENIAGDQGNFVALLTAYMQDAQRAERRADALEEQVRELREIIGSLVPLAQKSAKDIPKKQESSLALKAKIAWSPEEAKYRLCLGPGGSPGWKISSAHE
ncbi:hypothetical protein PSENEW3n2_00001944 [Picochlorum sp. SENEW3]|nr:hypothetical protein PSENEW3n2_00001944 [Picochlorum sp. SENEW3]WPT14714.1 hypothetical protein PSENEW3_00001944 [Picochlorum sp. SENEW3]